MKLLWLDLEMTGLDVEKEVIIEVGAIVTDLFFNELESYHSIVNQDKRFIDSMDEWNKKTHSESGLIEKIPSGRKPHEVELDLINIVSKHFGAERAVLAGNSIAQDRLFIDKYFKNLSAKLHYRMLDVTSWKILMKERFAVVFDKKNKHRADDDIRESIAELAHYIKHIQV